MASDRITRAFVVFIEDGDAEACLAALEAIPSRLWTEDNYQVWDERLQKNQEIHFSHEEMKDVGRMVGKFMLIFKYAYKAVRFWKSRPNFPLKRCQGYLLSAFKAYHRTLRSPFSDKLTRQESLQMLEQIPNEWLADENSVLIMKLFTQLQCDLLGEEHQNKRMPYMTFFNLYVSEKTKPPPRQAQKKKEASLEEKHETEDQEAKRYELSTTFNALKKLGFKTKENYFVFLSMNRMFKMFKISEHSPTKDRTEVLDAISSLPKQLFPKDPENKWFLAMDYVMQFFEVPSFGVADEDAAKFRAFFREQYWKRNGKIGPTPIVTFPPTVSISDVSLIDTQLSTAFDKFYDDEPKLTWAYGCLQRIFQAVPVDEAVKQSLRWAIERMYMRKKILKEAREPNLRDTDFMEFFEWFCAQQGKADEGRLSKLQVIVKELDTLVSSWGA